MSSVRVRFAPSPTGLLHIGGARTALFNWLYARHTGGTFVLRVEDTDAARNTDAATQIIFDGLRWLGLDWDEGPQRDGGHGPYFQSQRGDIYQRYVRRLLDEDKAYVKDGAVKFRMPKEPRVMHDLICGDVTIDPSKMVRDPNADMDLVIQRSDGSPVFHLVNVVDDIEMAITCVIRGEDHLSNTPKHLALFDAFGATPPQFAHIPLILNRDGSKMSKRDQGASIGEYMDAGYVPDALRNYLCLLGWSPKDNRDFFPIEDAVAKFDLPQINRGNARFDLDKLFWLNGEYMRAMAPADYQVFVKGVLEKKSVSMPEDQDYLGRVLTLVQEKVKLAGELPDWTRPFFCDEFPYDEEAKTKWLTQDLHKTNLRLIHEACTSLTVFDAASLEAKVKELATASGQKAAAFVHPCRVATSGRSVGPSLYHMLEVLGRERVLARLSKHC